jgi:short subunit dehydrogenase-like uncharacterized protein
MRAFLAVHTLVMLCSMAAATEFDVILFGATGCVGHLAALHLANQTGLSWVGG